MPQRARTNDSLGTEAAEGILVQSNYLKVKCILVEKKEGHQVVTF